MKLSSEKEQSQRCLSDSNVIERRVTDAKVTSPVELLYYEEYDRIDDAFYREKQIQRWSRKKKEALIRGDEGMLSELAKKVFRK